MKNILVLLLVGLLSCKTAKNESDQNINVDQIATDLLKEKYDRSDKGDFALFYTSDKTPGISTRNVLVLSISSGEPVYGPLKLNGDVDWHDENILKINEYPGVIEDANKKPEGPYYYNVLTKKKFSDFR